MDYKASWDRWTWGITILALGIIVIVVFRNAGLPAPNHTIPVWRGLIYGFVIGATVVCYLFRTLKYTITDNQLIIHRPIGMVGIDLADITEVKIIDIGSLPITVRIFGSGGFFGFYGSFYNSELGNFTMYATKRSNRVLINTRSRGKIIITPDDLGLCDALAARMG